MTDQFTEMDVIELGQYTGEYPADGDAAAELMKRSLEKHPGIKAVERTHGNQIVFVQSASGSSLSWFGKDYDFDLHHVATAKYAMRHFSDYNEDESLIVTLHVRGIREDYHGRCRPDYSPDGSQYKGPIPEPRLGDYIEPDIDDLISPVDMTVANSHTPLEGTYLGVIDRIVDGEYAAFEIIDGESVKSGSRIGNIVVDVTDLPDEGRHAGAHFKITADDTGMRMRYLLDR